MYLSVLSANLCMSILVCVGLLQIKTLVLFRQSPCKSNYKEL